MSDATGAENVVVDRRMPDGASAGSVELDPAVFGVEPNVALMHQVVTSQLAAARAGTHSTRTRAEVRGGGAKPYRQKGTGRARQGSLRSPQYVGGGVALGPKPRSYKQRTPKKMVRLALASALSDRAREGRVVVIREWDFDAPSTKDAVAALEALEIEGRALVVLGQDDWSAGRSFANLPYVQVTSGAELNAYDVLRCDWIVFTEDTLPGSSVVTEAEEEEEPGPEEEEEAGADVEADEEGSGQAVSEQAASDQADLDPALEGEEEDGEEEDGEVDGVTDAAEEASASEEGTP